MISTTGTCNIEWQNKTCGWWQHECQF